VGIKEFEYKGKKAFEVGRRLPMLESLHYVGNVREWGRIAERFDILQAAGGVNSCGFSFAFFNRKFVCWVGTTYYEDKIDRLNSHILIRRIIDKAIITPLYILIEGYIYKKCARIIAQSAYAADKISARFKIPRDKIVILPCPVDTSFFYPAKKNNSGKIVLAVGRCNDPRKNVPLLLQAFGKIKSDFPDSKLVLVGGKPSGFLTDMIVKHGLKDRVLFYDKVTVEELSGIYRSADIFVISSKQEGLCIAGLEAMASGLPVVSTDCGGPADFVKDGLTGYVVPLNDSDAMSKKLKRLLSDQQLRTRMGAEAREMAEDKFSFEIYKDSFDKIYREVWPELYI
jgi:glycosyltransferase involved in cell wall biosynthesis